MHIHILGICGTFMGGIAQLAKQAGHEVSGSDQQVYPPMSTQLEQAGITLFEGYRPADLEDGVDQVVVGNVMSRGNPAVEAMLNRGLPYTSGPQWLAERVLRGRWVLAVAGTHGKTTTASMLAWILEHAGMEPGFLIGGVPGNFGVSARMGAGPFFVVEADEYDTAFFDKRSKFVHYHPRTLILNNLEYDHADIFADVGEIQRQFHHLVRTVPGEGCIVSNAAEPRLEAVLEMGCWTPVQRFGMPGRASDWQAQPLAADGSAFAVCCAGARVAEVHWTQLGAHNVNNGLAAIAAARHVGVPPEASARALEAFAGVRRRLEVRGVYNGITLYDDFAHHPTAIRSTLEGLRARVGSGQLVAVLEPRSNTMRLGVHKADLAAALDSAGRIYLHRPADLSWSLEEVSEALPGRAVVTDTVAGLTAQLAAELRPGDHVVIMSNGSFGGLHERLAQALEESGKGDDREAARGTLH